MIAALLALHSLVHSIAVWHSYRGAEEQALAQVVRDYERDHPGDRVELLSIPYDAFAAKVTSAVPGGNGPDLFIFAHERIGGWAREGYLAPLDAEAAGLDASAVSIDGHAYGVPLALKTVALFYDKALVPQPPRTTAELEALAARMPPGVFGLGWPMNDFYFHAAFLHGFGGAIFQEPGHRPVLDTPQAIAALDYVRSLQRFAPEEPTSVLVTSLFNQHRLAMAISGPWFVGEIGKDVDYGIAPLPVVSQTGLPLRPFLSVEAALVSARAREPDGARRLARHLASPAAAAVRALLGRQVVATPAAYDDPRLGGDAVLSAFRRQAQAAVAMDNTPRMLSVWEPEKRALSAALGGAATSAEALAQAQRRLTATTRAAPETRSVWPYLALLGVALVAGGAWLARRLRREAEEPGLFAGEMARAYAYVAPAFAGVLVLVFLPFLAGTGLSFFHHDAGHYTFVGFANFIDILGSRDYRMTEPMSFWFTLGVTLLWTVCNVALHVGIGLSLALLLRDPLLRLKGVYRVLLIVPWAVPNYITALVWKGMFHRQFGAISALLEALGLQPISWFSRFSTAFAANVVTNTWLGFPFMMVVALGALQSIPADLYEAAAVDGASKWKQFRHITLPLLRPALLPAVILGSVWTFNMFNIIYLVSGGEPGGATDILVSEAYRWAFQRNEQFGFAAAYSTLIFIFLLGYSAITRRVAREPEAA